mgnify:CR=1 FL=1
MQTSLSLFCIKHSLLGAGGQTGGIVKGLGQPPLGVRAGVDEVGVVEGKLNSAVADVVGSLHTQHEGVVLVTDLVAPATETATGVDVHVLQLGQELLEDTLTLKRGSGVAVVEAAVVGRDNLILGLDHVGVDKTLDAVPEEVLLINRLERGLGNLEHDGPVGALLGIRGVSLAAISLVKSRQLDVVGGLVVRRVVGEDGGAVEGAVVLREVQPALVTNALRTGATDTNTDDVGGGVEEALGELDELLVAHLLSKVVNSHGVDELVVANGGAIGEGDNLLLGVDLGDLAALAKALLLLRDSLGNSDPDTTGTVTSREAESGVGTPVTGNLVQDDVLGDGLDIGSGNTLAEPCGLHL